MKSFCLGAVLILTSGVLCAEEMSFVTLLSQPVGSFSTVEIVEDEPAEIYHLNFCNTQSSLGTISVSGTDTYPVQASQLLVRPHATLGGNVKEFVVQLGLGPIHIGSTADFRGGRLQARNTSPQRILVDDGGKETGEAAMVHSNPITTQAANFRTMEITDTAVLNTPATSAAGTLSSKLNWQQVPGPEADGTGLKAYLLTDWSEITYVERPSLEDQLKH